MASKSKKVKPLSDYEAKNMNFMKKEFSERHASLLGEKARYEFKLALRAATEAAVQKARESVERTHSNSKKKANSLTRRFKKIHGTLKANREYAMHVNSISGEVTSVQPPSFTNILVRWTPIMHFNDAKTFMQNPKATLQRKTPNPPPEKWVQGDAITTPEYPIHTSLLDGKMGKWKADPKFIHADSGVIYKDLTIVGVFKEYTQREIDDHPDLIFCSKAFWLENGVLKDI